MAQNNNGGDDLISGINVTPLVDVTLVLLIIFMVTAKIIVSQGMPMDLPKAANGEQLQTVFSVELSIDGHARVDSQAVPSDEAILDLARKAHEKTKDLRAVIRADKKVEHGRVIHVLDLLKQAGIAKIAFAVSPGLAGAAPTPVTTQPAAGTQPPAGTP
ncbi:MAG TPA: biopolymer transporter ExbD [Polyangiaceae bacterium]|nr:biopolymer transporter ExbD [Polyangiaceae bacterium]